MAREYSYGEIGDQPPFAADTAVPKEPHEDIGFELDIHNEWWSFTPIYYPGTFRIGKNRELNRDARQCGGENISVKTIKNREAHVKGKILATEVPVFNKVMDYEGTLDLISPKTPAGGLECKIHKAELGELAGWDPIEKEWRFEYSLDLISTGRDEHTEGDNGIVSALITADPAESDDFDNFRDADTNGLEE